MLNTIHLLGSLCGHEMSHIMSCQTEEWRWICKGVVTENLRALPAWNSNNEHTRMQAWRQIPSHRISPMYRELNGFRIHRPTHSGRMPVITNTLSRWDAEVSKFTTVRIQIWMSNCKAGTECHGLDQLYYILAGSVITMIHYIINEQYCDHITNYAHESFQKQG